MALGERLVSDKTSHDYKLIASSQACRESCSTECFTILDTAASGFQFKIKEAMFIKGEKPEPVPDAQTVGSGRKIDGGKIRAGKGREHFTLPPQSPLVFSLRVSFCAHRVRFNLSPPTEHLEQAKETYSKSTGEICETVTFHVR